MSNITLRTRWGLGPGIDPHFDARVGRIAVGLDEGESKSSRATGYLEFTGVHAWEYLEALMAVLYKQAPGGSGPMYRLSSALGLHDRPFVWTQVSALRYLTSDPNTGVALPMHDFNPLTTPGSTAEEAAQLQAAINRLHALTGDRLKAATMIGLTVSFEFETGGGALAGELQPSAWRRWLGRPGAWPGKRMQTVLFGGAAPSLGPASGFWGRFAGVQRFDAQRIGIAGGASTQLQRAMRDLVFHDPDPMPATQTGALDYGMAPHTGRGTIVGIVDFGCDFAHLSFRMPADPARSRVLALWDQNEAPEAPLAPPAIVVPAAPAVTIAGQTCSFGYGRVFNREQIDEVLHAWLTQVPQDPEAPYGLLGYDPHDHHYTQHRPGTPDVPCAHGTVVMEIAAGGPREAMGADPSTDKPIVRGVASEADIVFVQVRLQRRNDGRRVLNLNDVVDAVAFVFHVAEREQRPSVVNLSLNTMSGPHDGDGYFERRIASLLRSGRAGPQGKGRAVVIAAGNLPELAFERQRWQHLTDAVRPGSRFEFFWYIPAADKTRNSIEIWYDASQAWLQVSLVSPLGTLLGPVAPGQAGEILIDGALGGSMIGSRLMPASPGAAVPGGQPLPDDDTAPGRHTILIEIDRGSDVGTFWTIALECIGSDHHRLSVGPEVPFHAWLERDDDGQSGLSRRNKDFSQITDADRRATLGTLSCDSDSLVVGAYSTIARGADRWNQSSRGPSRRGDNYKPDLTAPGHALRVIRSKAATGGGDPVVTQSGTSLAAPFVTGTIACLYEVAPEASLAKVRDALTATGRQPPLGPSTDATTPQGAPTNWTPLFGHGLLNPAAAMDRIRNPAPGGAPPTEGSPATDPT